MHDQPARRRFVHGAADEHLLRDQRDVDRQEQECRQPESKRHLAIDGKAAQQWRPAEPACAERAGARGRRPDTLKPQV